MFLVFYRLYRCVASQTERLHFTSSPRWNPGGFINETAICDALTDLTICGIETECKKMANGMFYTTASVWKIFTNYKLLKHQLSTLSTLSNFSNSTQNPRPEILIAPKRSLGIIMEILMVIFPNLEVALLTKGHLMRNSASKIVHSKKAKDFLISKLHFLGLQIV